MSLQEVESFFARYNAAFDALDGDAVAALWHTPSGITDAKSVVWWETHAPMAENMRALCDAYRRAGYTRATHRIEEFMPLGPHDAFANVAWTIENGQSNVLQSFRTGYNLRKIASADGEKIQVLLCTAYEEDIKKL